MSSPVFQQSAYVAEIEQTVLGSMMFGAAQSDAVAPLRDYHFVEEFHQHVFRAIKAGVERYGSASPLIVKKLIPEDAIQKFEQSDERRVSSYLARLLGSATSGAGISPDAPKRIIEQWARLSIANEAGRIYSAANDPAADVRMIAGEAAKSFDDIMAEVRSGGVRKSRSSIASAASRAIDAAIAAKNTKGLTGVTWGLADINRLTGGMQRKDLTLIGARPSMGKTTIATSVAMKAAQAGHCVCIVSLEMDADKLSCRAISDALYDWSVKIPYADIIRGEVDDRDFDIVSDQQTRMESLPIIIDDQAGQTLSDIRSRAERLIEETEKSGNRLAVLMIDHLGLIRASSRYSGNRVNEIAEITAGLKSLARELDIAVVLLSQLNRAVESRENKRPTLADLRDSGAIEQDADTIAFLYRDAYYLERQEGGTPEQQFERADKLESCRNSLEFIIAKQRNGPLETVHLFADMAFSAVRNGARQ